LEPWDKVSPLLTDLQDEFEFYFEIKPKKFVLGGLCCKWISVI